MSDLITLIEFVKNIYIDIYKSFDKTFDETFDETFDKTIKRDNFFKLLYIDFINVYESSKKIQDLEKHMNNIIDILRNDNLRLTNINFNDILERDSIKEDIHTLIINKIKNNKSGNEDILIILDDLHDEQLSDVEKRFMFFMNLISISKNIISRIKPLFRLDDVLKKLKIDKNITNEKIIALYAVDNIFSIELLSEIVKSINDDGSISSQVNQQLKYIYGILKSSTLYNEYNEYIEGASEIKEEDASEKKLMKMTTTTTLGGSDKDIKKIISDFINDKINLRSNTPYKDDNTFSSFYDLNNNTYLKTDDIRDYKISLYQFNMLISDDKKYVKNMFDVLFAELKINFDEIIEKKTIIDFVIFLFNNDDFSKKLNYMHGKQPCEEYSILDANTKNKIKLGLDEIYKIDTTVTDTFNNFKHELLEYLKSPGDTYSTYDNGKDITNIIGDVKHTIDTIMKIFYEAYLLGKKCNESKKRQRAGKYYNYKNTGIKKIFNKKEICIYKMQGSNKEYVRHKNELISFKDFKTINNKPVKTDKKPVNTEKKSVKTDNKSVKTDKKSVKTDKKPVKTDKKPVKTDKKPVKTDKKPVKTDKKPVKTDKKPVKTDKKPVKTDNKPVKTDKKPVKKNIFFNLF